jgi:hypothetical protein
VTVATIEEQFWVVERQATRGLWSWRDLPFFVATCQADALVRNVRNETWAAPSARAELRFVPAPAGQR